MSNKDEKKPIRRKNVSRGLMNLVVKKELGEPPESGSEKSDYMEDQRRAELGQKLIEVTKSWDFETFKEMVADPDVPIDYEVPRLKGTVLHDVASFGSVRMYEVLLTRKDEIDFLARDWNGCLASELAAEHSDRNNLSQMLMEEEIEAARKIGATLTPRQTIFSDGRIDPPPIAEKSPSPAME